MLKLLLKKQLLEIFQAYFYDAKKNKARSKVSTGLHFLLFALLVFGLLGGIFTFGILSLLLYGKLFFDSIKRTFVSHRIRKIDDRDDRFKKCVAVYMMLSCILLNIFDAQRIWCMPLYLSIVYFAQNSPQSNK